MRGAPTILVMLAVFLPTGCSSIGKKSAVAPSSGEGKPAVASGERGGAPREVENAPLAPPPPPAASGVLAGQVLDSFNRRPANAYIQVVEAGSDTSKSAPIDVAADSLGYFTIQGLQPGKSYQLTARARDGDRLLAGSTWAKPPDPKLVIRMSEDLRSSQTPPIPPPPVWPGPNADGGRGARPLDVRPPPMPRRAAELGAPIGISEPPTPPPLAPDRIGAHPERPRDPLLRQPPPWTAPPRPMEPPRPSPPVPTPPPPNPTRPVGPAVIAPAPALGPARVPSCVLTGNTLDNLALREPSGQPWEFRHHRGKLILLDFCGSWCGHCLQAIPHLNSLHDRYGPYGLEIVGIAYEDGPLADQVRKVEAMRQKQRIRYRLLLGEDRTSCPVRTQFAVRAWPTLVLLDDAGHILWRGEGNDVQQRKELELLVKQRLGLQ